MPIYRVALPLRLPFEPDGYLDYHHPEMLAQGTPVLVNLRNKSSLGIIWDQSLSSPHTVKDIEYAWKAFALNSDFCQLLARIARYYHQPIGMILHLALPPDALRYFLKPPRSKRSGVNETTPQTIHYKAPSLTLNEQQAAILNQISEKTGFQTHLIHGITGSGKTELYKHLAYRTLQAGKQVLWLVPEIKLTPQLFQHLAPEWSEHLVALHSLLTPAQRFKAWQKAHSGEARLIIGTRLAVFTPLPDVGLIIVDEEHDGSFSQHDGVRYHARDAAIWRAKACQCPVILGSATPSLESYVNAVEKKIYHYHTLRSRAIAGAGLPTLKLIPKVPTLSLENPRAPLWSNTLDQALEQRLAKKEQSLLFLNRRGYAPLLHCAACGWSSNCLSCSVKMVWHKEDRRLRCHHCGASHPVPKSCPECGHLDIFPMGLGTQKLEEAIRERFPDARVARIDQDSMKKKKSWEETLEAIAHQRIDIMIGTQMLAKGHHFPKLTLVGILGMDDVLYSGDFRATEHGFAQLMQVAGRAGRAELAGEVLIETNYPEHPFFHNALTHNYTGAAEEWKEERKTAGLPPFEHYALIWGEAKNASTIRTWIREVYKRHVVHTESQLSPPMPALIEKRAGWHRYYFMVHSAARKNLHHTLQRIEHDLLATPPPRQIKWRIDVDPQSI